MSAFEKVEFAANDERRTWRRSLLWPVGLLMAVGVLALAGNARAAVISFETSEGFPPNDADSFDGLTNSPAGVVDKWTSLINENGDIFDMEIDHGPGGGGFGDEPAPITGTQIALIQSTGSGSGVLEMDLNNSPKFSLVSFNYANRGGFPPTVTVEYFGLNELSLGTDTYAGAWSGGVGVGLDFGYNPKFQLLAPSAPFLGVPLSKVIFTSSPANPASQGSGELEDITLSPAVPEPSSFILMGLAGIAAFALHRGKP